MMTKREKKGFTLAELLIVIAIIAILIAIAVPVFSSSMKRANEATDCANIRALKAAAVAWYLDESATPTSGLTYPATLTLCSDGTAVQGTLPSGKNAVTYKLNGSDNDQLGGLGISKADAKWSKGGSVQCTVASDGGVTFE